MPGASSASTKVQIPCGKFAKPEDRELHELAVACGVVIDPDVFSLLVDLLRLDISPSAVFTMLQTIAAHHKPQTQQKKPNPSSRPTSVSTPVRKKPQTATKPTRKVNIVDA